MSGHVRVLPSAVPDDGRPEPPTDTSGGPAARSRWSNGSVGSILSVGSVGSILSVGSVGSILSVGSVGSILSLGSVGSALSISSVGSFLGVASVLSFRSVRSVLSAGARRRVLSVGSQTVPEWLRGLGAEPGESGWPALLVRSGLNRSGSASRAS